MRESGYYPPGAENDPRAPWNEVEGEDATEVIDDLDGKSFYESHNHEIDGSLDCYDGRVEFEVPDLLSRPWRDLSEEERALFEQYAAVVRGFAHLYEQGMALE